MNPTATALRVFAVDDEDGFLTVLERLLTTLGYQVRSFTDANHALDSIHEADLLLTDVFMPEMDGIQLALRARQASPNIPVVFMSGSPIESPDGSPLIKKPFSRAVLDAAIKAALANRD